MVAKAFDNQTICPVFGCPVFGSPLYPLQKRIKNITLENADRRKLWDVASPQRQREKII